MLPLAISSLLGRVEGIKTVAAADTFVGTRSARPIAKSASRIRFKGLNVLPYLPTKFSSKALRIKDKALRKKAC